MEGSLYVVISANCGRVLVQPWWVIQLSRLPPHVFTHIMCFYLGLITDVPFPSHRLLLDPHDSYNTVVWTECSSWCAGPGAWPLDIPLSTFPPFPGLCSTPRAIFQKAYNSQLQMPWAYSRNSRTCIVILTLCLFINLILDLFPSLTLMKWKKTAAGLGKGEPQVRVAWKTPSQPSGEVQSIDCPLTKPHIGQKWLCL